MADDKRARKKQNRQARIAQQRREARLRAARRRIIVFGSLTVLLLALLALPNLLSSDDDAFPSDAYRRFWEQPVACGGERPDSPAQVRTFDSYPALAETSGTLVARVATSCGPFEIELDPLTAPETTAAFVFLAEQGFYEAVPFHRIVPDFVVQAGDPTATGTGGPGFTVPDEFPPEGFVYTEGTVAMANTGRRNSTGSQFFVAVGPDAAALAPRFNVLGRVTTGQDTLERIEAVPVTFSPSGEESLPRETVWIEAVTIERRTP